MRFVLLLLISLPVFAVDCTPQYDHLGIPHQQVKSSHEFYYCFGFHHGKDRGWEMDYFRRVGQGRNAEVLGMAQLKNDLMMRLLNLPALAEKIWGEMDEEKKKLLNSYAAGANAGFKIGKEAKEFKDQGYEPEDWKPVDSVLVLLVQSFDQTRKTFTRDYDEQKSIEHWGSRAPELFDEDHFPWQNNILKEGEYQSNRPLPAEKKVEKKTVRLWQNFPTVFGEESGSNNLVISSKKSQTKKAILANDPHLDLKTPLFWYWIHLKSPEQELIGASLPGVPVVASGTNGKVAWGLTNSYINTADAVFISDLKEEQLETVRPVVWVKFWFIKWPFFFKKFERLKTGHPILPLELKTDKKMALRWSGFHLSAQDMTPMFDLSTVKNVEGMDELLKSVGVPAWNFVFADQQGDIGYRMVGKSYRHEVKIPFGVPEEKLEDFLLADFLDPMERPHVLKPKRNYVYSANNRHWPEDSKFYGGRGYSYSFRGFRIDELLQGTHDTETFKSIQCDRQVVDARFFLPKLFKVIDSELLRNWNLKAQDSSREVAVYRRFMDIIMDEWKVNEYALFRLLDELTPKMSGELKEFYTRALQEVGEKTWGELHILNFEHLSKNESWVFSPQLAGIGDTHTVDPGTARWNAEKKRYDQYSGASMRMIIELDDKPRIYLSLPGLNRNYTSRDNDQAWQEWKNCAYSRVSF